MVELRTRRWNDPAEPGDGFRILVCRHRPRGVARARETWDAWWKELGPSPALHAAAYGKRGPPIDFAEYRRRFIAEMAVDPGRFYLKQHERRPRRSRSLENRRSRARSSW